MSSVLAAVDAILFDFDGVILDTVPPKEEQFRQMILEQMPEHVDAAMEYFHANGGTSRVNKFEWIWANIVGQPISRGRAEEMGAEYARRVRTCVLQAAFVKGTDTFLEEYHQRWPMFVISGTPQPELRELVELRGLNRYFRGVFGSPRGKVEIGEHILAEHGFDRQRVWFIGDATTDRDAARALGAHFVGLAGPHLTPFLEGDEIVVDDLTELPGILASA